MPFLTKTFINKPTKKEYANVQKIIAKFNANFLKSIKEHAEKKSSKKDKRTTN